MDFTKRKFSSDSQKQQQQQQLITERRPEQQISKQNNKNTDNGNIDYNQDEGDDSDDEENYKNNESSSDALRSMALTKLLKAQQNKSSRESGRNEERYSEKDREHQLQDQEESQYYRRQHQNIDALALRPDSVANNFYSGGLHSEENGTSAPEDFEQDNGVVDRYNHDADDAAGQYEQSAYEERSHNLSATSETSSSSRHGKQAHAITVAADRASKILSTNASMKIELQDTKYKCGILEKQLSNLAIKEKEYVVEVKKLRTQCSTLEKELTTLRRSVRREMNEKRAPSDSIMTLIYKTKQNKTKQNKINTLYRALYSQSTKRHRQPKMSWSKSCRKKKTIPNASRRNLQWAHAEWASSKNMATWNPRSSS